MAVALIWIRDLVFTLPRPVRDRGSLENERREHENTGNAKYFSLFTRIFDVQWAVRPSSNPPVERDGRQKDLCCSSNNQGRNRILRFPAG
jgi:hypothetical protein